MHEKLIRRYCRAVGSYLPCSPRQKREILLGLRQRLEDHCAEHPESAEDLETVFGTPQAVAAAYIDDMDTGELLAALRQRGCRVGIVSNKPDATVQRLALAIWLTACIISAIDLHKAAHEEWNETYVTVEKRTETGGNTE